MTAKKPTKSRSTGANKSKSEEYPTTFLVDPKKRTVVMTRVFAASPKRVFDAWTKPDQLRRWWGGAEGSRLAVCEVDLRPGGEWRFIERGSDGQDYPFRGVYREIDSPRRLVSTFIFDVEPWKDRAAVVTNVFADWKGGTKLTNTSVFRSVKDLRAFTESGMEVGATRSSDRLASFLSESAQSPSGSAKGSDRGHLTIERTLKAPVERVWKLFTTKKGLESWWGPEGFSTTVQKLEVRPGGQLEYVMTATAPDQVRALKSMGMSLAHKTHGTYTDVVPGTLLVFSQLADFVQDIEPYEILARIEFHPTKAGVRVFCTIDKMHDPQWTKMSELGWKSQLDRLAALV